MHLENAIFSSEYTIPVTTLPDLSCQNSPTLTTFAQTFEQYSPIKQYSIQNESRNCHNFFNFLENTSAVSQIINETNNDQTNNQYGCLLSNQEQMKLEKQFTSAFLDSVQTNDIFDANYSESAIETTAVDFTGEIQNQFENYIFVADDNWKKSTSPINETHIFNTETECSQENNPFFVPPPFQPFSSPSYSDNVPVLSPLNLPDDENSESLTIDLDTDLSNGSFDFNLFSGEFEENQCNENQDNCELENVKLAPMYDAFPNNCEFSNFLRNTSDSSLIPNKNPQQLQQNNNAFGHLLSTKSINNNLSEEQDAYPQLEETQNTLGSLPDNQIVLTQNDAILGSTDPFLSSTYYTYEPITSEDYDEDDYNNKNNFDIRFELETKKQCLLEENNEVSTRKIVNRKTCTWKEDRNAEKDNTAEEAVSTTYPEEHSYGLQCKWMECYENFNSQECLVRHIERFHVEIKKGDEFSCYWENCPRKNRPFNARYKLLIHMRVHSGEKPNKCPWPGCEKAFSRLENLKIHQRSHTGERPYRCQQAGCRKAFSNSSDRAKHQRTHVDTKPYACQVINCSKRYTDPSSLRKHVKNHSLKEQAYVKKRQKSVIAQCTSPRTPTGTAAIELEPTNPPDIPQKNTNNIKIDLKNKIINEKYRRLNEIISKKSCLSTNDFASMKEKNSSEQLTVDYDKNNEFIPYDSVKSLFSEQLIDYIDLNL